MSKEHFDAFEALLPATVPIHRGTAPEKLSSADYPYVVLGGRPGAETTEALAGDSDSQEMFFRITYAGLSFDAVLVVMRQVRDAIRPARLVVPGWSCGSFRHESLTDIRPDYDVTITDTATKPQYAIDEYTVFCTR